MFSALRQLKSAHLLLIAAKMVGTETPVCRMALALIRQTNMTNYFFA
jgi:hypothetical protein